MIFSTNSPPRPLLMLAKNRPQPPPYKAIHPLKGIRMRMLEVIKPATKRRIQIGDDFRQTVPTRALGPHSNAILHRLGALFAYPAARQLEVIAQKVKALPRLQTISHMGLVGTKAQAMGLYPGFYFRKRRFGLLPTAAKHHKVIGVANHAVALLLHVIVERMKINVGQKRANHRPLRAPFRWRPSLHLLDDVLLQIRFDQIHHPPIAHLFLNALHKPHVRNGVEVASKIGIHHKGVAFSKQPLHFPKCIFTAKPRTKTVTGPEKLLLKDGLQYKLKRRLHNAVFDHRYPQRTKLPASFGNLHAPHGLWSVGSPLKRCAKLLKIHLRPGRKSLHALTVYSCRPSVRLHFMPCRLKRLGSVHFVDQAEPFPSFDAAFQRRQHALTPPRSFHPRPIPAVSLCALCSPLGHCRRLAFAPAPLWNSRFHLPASRPSAQLCFLRFPRLSPLRYHEGSDSCAVHHPQRRSPRFPHHIFLPFRLQPRWAASTSLLPPLH